MKLPYTTLILVLLALGLGSFVYFYEIQGATQREAVQEKNQQLFSFSVDDVQSLAIKTQKVNLTLERSGQSSKPDWLLKAPVSAPANDAVVSYLLNLLFPGQSTRSLSVPPSQRGEFGLDEPQIIINIRLKNQKSHQLIVGRANFNRRFLYAQIDTAVQPDGNLDVLLVSPDFENAVNREISEWKQPIPSPNKPTPADKK
jgi:hypothetical protein